MPRGELDEVRFRCDARLDENSAADIGVSVIGVLRGTTVEIFGVCSDIIAGKPAPPGFMCATEHCGSWQASSHRFYVRHRTLWELACQRWGHQLQHNTHAVIRHFNLARSSSARCGESSSRIGLVLCDESHVKKCYLEKILHIIRSLVDYLSSRYDNLITRQLQDCLDADEPPGSRPERPCRSACLSASCLPKPHLQRSQHLRLADVNAVAASLWSTP
ncbi:hypothetical protein QF012_002073 [Pseudomonas laurylsulfatiphila]